MQPRRLQAAGVPCSPFARNLKRRVGNGIRRFARSAHMPTGYVRAIRSRAQRTSQCSTAQPTAQRGGMLRAFFSDQAAAMSSGKQHHKAGTPPPPVLQRVLMACSSLLYLCCSYAWSRFGYRWLGLWFCLVSALSVAADAGSGLLSERAIGRLRVADRLVGSIGLVTSVAINSDSIPHAGLCCLATASSLCWLAAGRAVPWAGALGDGLAVSAAAAGRRFAWTQLSARGALAEQCRAAALAGCG